MSVNLKTPLGLQQVSLTSVVPKVRLTSYQPSSKSYVLLAATLKLELELLCEFLREARNENVRLPIRLHPEQMISQVEF